MVGSVAGQQPRHAAPENILNIEKTVAQEDFVEIQQRVGEQGFALEYRAPWLYGVAALTNLSRVGKQEHWFSDTVASSVIGYGLGRAVTAGKAHVYMQAGTYAGAVDLVNGKTLYGGYNAACM